MSRNFLSSFLTLASVVLSVFGATPQAWGETRMIKAGSVLFSKNSTSGSMTQTLTINYDLPLLSATKRDTAVCMQDFSLSFPLRRINFEIGPNSQGMASFVMYVKFSNATALNLLRVRYFTVDGLVEPQKLTIFWITGYLTSGSIYNTYDDVTFNFTAFNGYPMPPSNNIVFRPFISQLIGKNSNSQDNYNFNPSITVVNSHQFRWGITTTNDFEVTDWGCFVIFVDQTLLFADSRWRGGSYFDFSAVNSNKSPLTSNIVNLTSGNLLFGITQWGVANETQLQFTSIYSGNTLSANSSRTFTKLKFSYYNLEWFGCPKTELHYNPDDKLCYNDCGPYYYEDQASFQFQCGHCYYACYQCSDSANCTECDPLDHRTLVGKLCRPMAGYYENGIRLCPLCTDPCETCTSNVTCISCIDNYYISGSNCLLCNATIPKCIICISSSVCTQCAVGYYVDAVFKDSCLLCNVSIPNCFQCASDSVCTECVVGYHVDAVLKKSCVLCDFSIPNCLQCSSVSLCTQCVAGYFFDSAVNACTPLCTVSNCSTCVLGQNKVCQTCQTWYKVSYGNCIPICGDGFRVVPQNCDDGNIVNDDGCSSTCQIESNFDCDLVSHGNGGQISDCAYTGPIDFIINHLQKVHGNNQVSAEIQIRPLLKAFETYNFSSLISTDLNVSNYEFKYDPVTGKLQMVLTYVENLEGKEATVLLTPPNSGVFRRTSPVSTKVMMQSRDNAGLYVYSDSTYTFGSIIQIISLILSILAWIIFLLSLFGSKLVGVEMMAVFQLTFFGLIAIPKMNPSIYGLTNLSVMNLANSVLWGNAAQHAELPLPFRALKLFSHFLQNFALSSILIVLPLLIALIALILSKTALKDKKQVAQKVLFRCLRQYAFTMIMVNGYFLAVSAALEMVYGVTNMNSMVSYMSIGVCIALLAVYIFYFAFKIVRKTQFGQFYESYGKAFPYNAFIYNWYMGERMLSGVVLVLLYSLAYSLAVPILLVILQVIFFLVKKSFKRRDQNIRLFVNSFITILNLFLFFYYAFAPASSAVSEVAIYLPLVVLLSLLVCLIYNAVFIIRNLRDAIQNYRDQSDQLVEVKDVLKALRLEAAEMAQFPPSPIMVMKMEQTNRQMLPQSIRIKLHNYGSNSSQPRIKSNSISSSKVKQFWANYDELDNSSHSSNSQQIDQEMGKQKSEQSAGQQKQPHCNQSQPNNHAKASSLSKQKKKPDFLDQRQLARKVTLLDYDAI